MEFIVDIDQISEDEPLRLMVAKRHGIGIYQNGDDYYCIDDWCPHAGGYMTQGPVEGMLAMCPIHGFQFEIDTGKCLQAAAFNVTNYPVTRRGDKLVINVEIDEADA
jgi:nitrite reductase/ring-hydroxylating ferredoxin subunit